MCIIQKLVAVITVYSTMTFAATQLPVFHTSGRFLLDPCGDTVIIRGFELPVNQIEYIPEVAKTGANFVRILISIAPAEYPTPLTDLDSMLALTKRSGMAADVSINNNAQDGSAFTQTDVKAVLMKYEDIITLHACGEGQQKTVEQWLTESESVITKIRSAGYRCPLFVLSTTSGRDPYTVLHNGQKLIDFDPLHNTLCGVQLYWGYDINKKAGWYINDYHMTDKQAIDSFAVMNFPIVAGINNHDPYGDPWLDYETQLTECQAKKISWFWWDWFNPYDGSGKYHISITGKYGDWGVVAAGAPDLDKFTVSGTGVVSKTYEAESFTAIADVGWGPLSHESTSNGKFLCCSGKRLPDWAEWNNIDGGSGGQATFTITYSNGSDFNMPVKIVLNSDTVGTFTCGNSGPGAADSNFWRVWKNESTTITLKAGMNTLRLVSTAKAGPFNPDYGEVTVLSSPASVAHTSIRTYYMQHHSCNTAVLNIPARPKTAVTSSLFKSEQFGVVVTDMSGRVIARRDLVNLHEYTSITSHLANGVYFVTMSDRTHGSFYRHMICR